MVCCPLTGKLYVIKGNQNVLSCSHVFKLSRAQQEEWTVWLSGFIYFSDLKLHIPTVIKNKVLSFIESRVLLLFFISSLYSSTNVSFYPKINGILSLLAADVPLRISSRSLLAVVGIGLRPIITSLFIDLVLIVAHDAILHPSNSSFI